MNAKRASFKLSENRRGLIAIFSDGISEDAIEYFETKAFLDQPVLSFAKGNYEHLEFLQPHADWISGIIFNNTEKVDWKTLNGLNNLISIKTNESLDTRGLEAASYPSLRWLDCYWNKNLEAKLFEFSTLESLLVRSFKSKNLSCINALKNLKHLQIAYSRTLKSIDEIADLRKLNYLWLDSNSQLGDIEAIGSCTSLKTLCVADNKKAFGYESIALLTKLEELILNASVPSLNWLIKLRKLRLLRFDCTVDDGDMCFLHEIDSLQHVYYRQKRNFNIKLKEIEANLRENGFDPESRDPDYGRFRTFPSYP